MIFTIYGAKFLINITIFLNFYTSAEIHNLRFDDFKIINNPALICQFESYIYQTCNEDQSTEKEGCLRYKAKFITQEEERCY